MGPLSAKQSHSFSLKSTCLKLLQVVLPQQQILQFKRAKASQNRRLWMWKDWTWRNPKDKQLVNLQSLVSIPTCRSAPHSPLEEGVLEWSVGLLPTMAVQLRPQLGTRQSRSVYWPHLATSCTWGILLASCHCYPMGLWNMKSLREGWNGLGCSRMMFHTFSPFQKPAVSNWVSPILHRQDFQFLYKGPVGCY